MRSWLRPIDMRVRLRIVRIALAVISVAIAVPTFVLPERSPLVAREPVAGEEIVALESSPMPVAPSASPAATPASVAQEQIAQGAPPAANDLQHEVYTATESLHATLIAPLDGGAASGPAAKIVAGTVMGAGIELAVNGDIVPTSRIGEKTIDAKAAQTRYAYYGISLKPGPNSVTVTPLGADGMRGPATSATIFGPGKPVALSAHIDGVLTADGRTPGVLVVQAFDEWHHPAMQGSGLKVSILSGDARFDQGGGARTAVATPQPVAFTNDGATGATRDAKLVKDAVLEPGGTVKVPIFPGVNAGRVELRVESGDLEERISAEIAPFLRKPLVNGLISVGAGAVPGLHGDAASAYDANDGRRGRIAVFGTGTLRGNTTATLAYDSMNTLMQKTTSGAFIDNPDQRPYLTYGDASSRRDDALSQDHLYARFDNGKRSLTYGQIQADTMGAQAVGGYRELVHGAQLELTGANAHATLFRARSDVAYARLTMNPSGLSTASQLLSPSIVVGSDTLTLVALDRRTGAPIAQTQLTRNVDYALDYTTGALRFINVPLPFDESFDPQIVLVQYQYNGTNASAGKAGGRVDLRLGGSGNLRLGAGYVNSSSGIGNYSLLESDLSGTLAAGSWSISRAQSSGLAQVVNTGGYAPAVLSNGAAWRARLATQVRGIRFDANYETTSAGYGNPFGGLTTPGLSSYRAALARGDAKSGEMVLSFDGEQNHGTGVASSQISTGLKLRRTVSSRMTLVAQIDSRSEHSDSTAAILATGLPAIGAVSVAPSPDPSSVTAASAQATPAPGTALNGTTTQARIGVDYKATQHLGLTVDRVTNIGGTSLSSDPSHTTAQVAYDLGGKGKIYARQLWSSAPTQSFASSTSGLTSSAQATSSFAIGAERAIGASTNIDSQYVVDKTASGPDLYAAIGVKERFSLGKQLRGDFALQRANASGTGASGFSIAGLTLNYASDARVRATAAIQHRTGAAGGTTMQAGLAGKLSSEFSAIGSWNESQAPTASSSEAKLGLAWRPSQNDAGATLLGFTRRTGVASTQGSATSVVSLEHDERLGRGLEVFGRAAYKLDGDSYYAAKSTLVGIGFDQRIGTRVDIGAEQRVVTIRNVAGAQATNVAVESGYRLGDALRFAVGYNVHGSADPSLTGAPVRRGFYATMTSVVDRIFGWGKPR